MDKREAMLSLRSKLLAERPDVTRAYELAPLMGEYEREYWAWQVECGMAEWEAGVKSASGHVPPLHPDYPVSSRYFRGPGPLPPGRCRFCRTSHKFGACPDYEAYLTWLSTLPPSSSVDEGNTPDV